jgi:steroid delta-isomerase-like uncharacterized protein
MATTQTSSPIRLLLYEAFNHGNLAIVDELLSSDHLAHNALGGAPNGPGGLKWLVAMFRAAFPDLHCTVEDEIIGGDMFSAHWTMRGTHKGLFMGNQPTGKQIQVHGIIFAKFEDGMVVEYWMLIDQLGMLQQLGIIPR